MWGLCRKTKKKIGLMVTCIGVGVVLVVILPIWGWIGAGGIALIVWGWNIMGQHRH